jgi:hypothetical protein
MDDDREFLELKLKYVQSVGTIFRQKIGLLLHDLLANRTGDDHISALRKLVNEMDSMESPSDEKNDSADYWRERFLQSMEESRPSSLREAQTLCGILQERSDLQTRERDLARKLTTTEAELQKMKESYMNLLDAKAMTAEDALIERYKAKEADLVRIDPESGRSFAVAEAEQLRGELMHLSQKGKLMRLRNEQLRKQLEDCRLSALAAHDEHTAQLAELVATVNDLRANCAVRDAAARRAESDRAAATHTVILKEHTISRLEARVSALEKEVEAALKEGAANATTTETSILRRQIDSFELKIRNLEADLSERAKENERLQSEAYTLRETIASKDIVIDAKSKLADLLSKRLETLSLADQQRDCHTTMLHCVEERMSAAISDVATRQSPVSLTSELTRMIDGIQSLHSQKIALEAKKNDVVALQEEISAYKSEMEKSVKLQRAPNLDFVESEVVRKHLQMLSGETSGSDRTLRMMGSWCEVRDVASGKLMYITTDVSQTPFKPAKLRSIEPAQPPPPPPPPPPPTVPVVVEPPPSPAPQVASQPAAEDLTPEPVSTFDSTSSPKRAEPNVAADSPNTDSQLASPY